MSVIVNNYSQFYKGTEKVKQYGSGAGSKDTLVRYEFNTRDAAGNKVMDKMSREETLQAMKEISSQYGDNVIVEFSGDGMAKLVESQKGYLCRELSEEEIAARAAKQAEFDEQVVHMEGTYKKVEGNVSGDDFHSILKANDPELAKQVEEMNMRIINHKPGDPSNAAEFKKLMPKAMNVVNAANEKKTAATNNLLERLRKTYGNIDFYVAGKGSDPKSLLSGSTKEYSVIFSAEEWEKMLSDENYAKEKMQSIDKILQMTKKLCEQEGYVSALGKGNQESVLKSVSVSVGDDGKMTIFADLEKMTEKQRERIEEARDKKAEYKKNKDNEKVVKKTTVEASSVEELIEKIKNIDWRDIKER